MAGKKRCFGYCNNIDHENLFHLGLDGCTMQAKPSCDADLSGNFAVRYQKLVTQEKPFFFVREILWTFWWDSNDYLFAWGDTDIDFIWDY